MLIFIQGNVHNAWVEKLFSYFARNPCKLHFFFPADNRVCDAFYFKPQNKNCHHRGGLNVTLLHFFLMSAN